MINIIFKEMRYRWIGTLITTVAFAAPVSMIFAAMILLNSYSRATESALTAKEKEIDNQIKDLNEEYRKITLTLGFNILILPAEQNLGYFYSDDFAMADMPESYTEKLSNSKLITINHLLPVLFKKIVWKETRRTILVTGIQGEIPLLHRTTDQKSLLEAVPRGHIVLGSELWEELHFKEGDLIKLNGRKFTVSKCNEPRGTVDDITVWIDLKEAQEIFSKPGKISAMFALECRCDGTQNLANIAQIREDVTRILPQTQVIEFMSEALTRAEARWRVVTLSKEKISQQKQYRENVIKTRQHTATVLISFILPICLVLVLWLTYKNISDRRLEYCLFRSLGISTFKIWIIFSGRAGLVGFTGWVLGSGTGILCSIILASRFSSIFQTIEIPSMTYYGTALVYISSIILISGYLFIKVNENPGYKISGS